MRFLIYQSIYLLVCLLDYYNYDYDSDYEYDYDYDCYFDYDCYDEVGAGFIGGSSPPGAVIPAIIALRFRSPHTCSGVQGSFLV